MWMTFSARTVQGVGRRRFAGSLPPSGWLADSVPCRPAPAVVWLDRGDRSHTRHPTSGASAEKGQPQNSTSYPCNLTSKGRCFCSPKSHCAEYCVTSRNVGVFVEEAAEPVSSGDRDVGVDGIG
jgi:hypothetical protein